MIKVRLDGEEPSDQINRWVDEAGDGRIRDALNVALARLESAEADIGSMVNEIRDLREASDCPDCGQRLNCCLRCDEAERYD